MDDDIKQLVHTLNKDATKLNKNIINQTNALQNIPINNIYNKNSTPNPVKSNPATVTGAPITEVSYQQSDLKVIEKLTKNLQSIEKKIDRFFNLIEKRVVNNAKEINIRIKLNEANENTNSGQE